jgi:ribose transport system ATP-binding protein
MDDLLGFRDIRKEYPGVVALADVNLGIRENEIHGIVGENGAGKSTLLKIIAGEICDYSGDLVLKGKKIRFKNPHDAISAGVSIVYQELNLCPNLNAVQNLFLGRELKNKLKVDWMRMARFTQEYLEDLNLKINVRLPIRYFSTAQQQIIEIAKATASESRIVIMDEPTSALNRLEVERLFALLKNLKSRNVTIVFVSHRINEVLQITDRLTVLRNGNLIDTLETCDATKNQIVKLMTGHSLILTDRARSDIRKKPEVLRVANLSRAGAYHNASLTVHEGEIVGISGLEGSGRFELGRAIFGLLPYESGRIFLLGQEVRIRKPIDAIQKGIGFISRDRKGEGIFRIFDLIKNITIVISLKERTVNDSRNVKVASQFVESLRIVCTSIRQNISSLSGGNQQKSIVARWLAKRPRLIIMEEPTHGIDVGAKAEMFEIIRELARGGTSVVIISSELNELISECDRILVMRNGEIGGEVASSETNEQEIMAIATGITR